VIAALGGVLLAIAAIAEPLPRPKPADMTAAPPPGDAAAASTAPVPAAEAKPDPAATRAVALNMPAKQVFGALPKPADMASRAIGFYAKGCLAGGVALPISGQTWQVMRLSRNRNWGTPELIALLEKLSQRLTQTADWRGLLVGDIAQPRGGPMLTGHASHQIGLDADVWLTEMPPKTLSTAERENMVPINLVASDWNDVDKTKWKPEHLKVLKTAAMMPEVERIFINPAIKKALCREAGDDRGWLAKMRPTPGHNYHFHIRMRCPSGMASCKPQAPPPAGDGCGKELDYWFSDAYRKPKPRTGPPPKPAPPMTLAELPEACRAVAVAP
jgi:penicillin-insensitive murein DD-endopeptidase